MNYRQPFAPHLIIRHTGQRFPLGQGTVTFGSADDNRIVLADPQASPHHAAITWQAGTYIVQDLGSRDGTYVNDWRITSPQPLYDGDAIRLGDTQIDIRLEPSAAGAPPPTVGVPVAETPRPAPPRAYRPYETQAYGPPGPAEAADTPLPVAPAARARTYRAPAAPDRRSSLPLIIGLILLGILIAGLVIGGLFALLGGGRGRPVVTIQSPGDNEQIVAGDPFTIQATATGVRDITRLELSIDGVVVGTAGSADPAGQPSITASQPWTFAQPGAHTISVAAYTAGDGSSASESVNVEVVSSVAEVTPTVEPSPTSEPPTATPEIPTDTPAPTDTPPPAAPVIEFAADDTSLALGETTVLRWHVENVQAVYLNGSPVTGPDGQVAVQPAETTTYELRVVHAGGEETRQVAITVEQPAGEVTATLTSQAALDGIVANDGGIATDLDVSAGNGAIGGQPEFEVIVRGFMSFDLSEIPAGATVTAAELRFYQAQVEGDPYGKLQALQLKWVDYGDGLNSGDFDTAELGSISLDPVAASGAWYSVSSADLVSWVQNAVNGGQGRIQFRLQFASETDGDGEVDLAKFEPGDNVYGTGNVPQLVITLTP